jgi:hypothetical protein
MGNVSCRKTYCSSNSELERRFERHYSHMRNVYLLIRKLQFSLWLVHANRELRVDKCEVAVVRVDTAKPGNLETRDWQDVAVFCNHYSVSS